MKKSMKLTLLVGVILLIGMVTLTGCYARNSDTTDGSNEEHVHDFGDWIVTEEATCAREGSKERICTCGEKEIKRIEVLEHTEVIDNAVASTCIQTGLTEGKHCSVCDTVIIQQAITPIIDHIYDNENDEECNVCGAKNPNYVKIIEIGELTHTTTTIDKLTHKSIEIDDAVLKVYNGKITKEDQKDIYSFKAPRDGIYRFDLSNMNASMTVELYIYDKIGKCISSDRAIDNKEGLTVSLSANETYEICVREYDRISETKLGSYTLTIWYQKPTVDVTDYTIINDSIEYEDQRNKYTFTPSISGTYRFDFSNMKSSTTVEIYIYDDLDECISSDRAIDNKEGLTVSLSANETYEIWVREYDLISETKLGEYTLTIWHQKPTTDVSSKVKIKDSIQYTDQKNVYNFTVDATKDHTLKITGLSNSVNTEIYVYDNLDYRVAYDTSFANNETITLKNLEIGANYRIVVCQRSGTGNYTLTIE